MKKIFFALLALTFVFGTFSCTKDQTVIDPGTTDNPSDPPATPTEPTYQEGVYAPLMKIATINRDESVQVWTWDGEQLLSVYEEGGDSRQFTYSDGRVATATGSMTNLFGMLSGVSGTMTFTYNGTQLKNCTANTDGTDIMLTTFNHADNRISSLDIALDADYLSGMLNDMFTGGVRAVDPKGVTISESDNSIHSDLVWTGKNVTSMVTAGTVPFQLSKETYENLKPYLPLDSSMLRMVDLYFSVANSLPMQIAITDTITYTYDTKINPYYCYMGEVTPSNLSLNNVLSSNNTGSIVVSVALGSPTPVHTQPINERSVYFYEYNDKNYPTKVEGTDNYTITYKE